MSEVEGAEVRVWRCSHRDKALRGPTPAMTLKFFRIRVITEVRVINRVLIRVKARFRTSFK